MSRARLGLEAPAWARLDAAWASKSQAQARSPKQGLQAQGLGLGPGLPRNFSLHLEHGYNCWLQVIFTPYSQARASGPGSGLGDLKPKPQARSSPLSGPAWLGLPGPGLAGFRASGRALDITKRYLAQKPRIIGEREGAARDASGGGGKQKECDPNKHQQ
ncbi:hypothetical protein C8R43DRAFT_948433 [Mycena crocata]|nr:hypothetical protein C8R43DRAFT_948433 [Mycena crocata]